MPLNLTDRKYCTALDIKSKRKIFTEIKKGLLKYHMITHNLKSVKTSLKSRSEDVIQVGLISSKFSFVDFPRNI